MREFELPQLTPETESQIYDILSARLAVKIFQWFQEEAIDHFDFAREGDLITDLIDDEDPMDVHSKLWRISTRRFANMLLDQ